MHQLEIRDHWKSVNHARQIQTRQRLLYIKSHLSKCVELRLNLQLTDTARKMRQVNKTFFNLFSKYFLVHQHESISIIVLEVLKYKPLLFKSQFFLGGGFVTNQIIYLEISLLCTSWDMLDIYVTMLFYRVTHLDVWLYRKIFSTRNVNAVFSCAQLDWDFQHDEPTLLGFFCFNIFPALENFQTPWYFDFSFFFCSIKLIFDDKSSSFFTK